MNLSALEHNINDLEILLDSLERWLSVMTGLVVLGLIIEYWYEIPDAITELKRAKRLLWKPGCVIVGAILITLGVAGELGVQFYASDKQTALRKANDEEFASLNSEAAKARKDAGDAVERASKADERAAANERDAARLNKEATAERLARVNIEKQLAPRNLTKLDRQAFSKQLRRFAPSFLGRKVKVSSYSADAEGIVFSLEIVDLLTSSGINVEPIIGRLVPVGLVNLGVKITGPIADETFIRALGAGIRARVDTSIEEQWDAKYNEVQIEVGVKPVAGLPKVIPAQ